MVWRRERSDEGSGESYLQVGGESFFIYAEPLDLGCRENFVWWVCTTANG